MARALSRLVSTMVAGAVAAGLFASPVAANDAPVAAPSGTFGHVISHAVVSPRAVAATPAIADAVAAAMLPSAAAASTVPATSPSGRQPLAQARVVDSAPSSAASLVTPSISVAGTLRSVGFTGLGLAIRNIFSGPGSPADAPLRPSIAVGPSAIVGTTDQVMAELDRAGNMLWALPLSAFFQMQATETEASSARVFYLPAYSRWILVDRSQGPVTIGGTTNPNAGRLWVAVSETADPSGSWWSSYILDVNGFSQSYVGLSDDKLAIAAKGASGSHIYVVDLADVVADGAFDYYLANFDSTYGTWVPAVGQPASGGSIGMQDLYAVGQRAPGDGTFVPMLARIRGSVLAHTVDVSSAFDLSTLGLAKATALTVSLHDPTTAFSTPTAPVAAIEQSGRVWFSATAAGTPAHVELVELGIGADLASTSLQNDIAVSGTSGTAATFGAGIGLTTGGRLRAIYSETSLTENVSVYEVDRVAANAANTISLPTLIDAGSVAVPAAGWEESYGLAQDPVDGDLWQVSRVPDNDITETFISKLTSATQTPAGTIAFDRGAYYTWFSTVELTPAIASTVAATVVRVTTPDAGAVSSATRVMPLSHLFIAQLYGRGVNGRVQYQIGDGQGNWSAVQTVTIRNPGTTTRLSGSDRYETAADTSAKTFGTNVPVAYVATGLNFPDALAGAAVAGPQGGPVLMVSTNEVPASTSAELTRLRPDKIYVLGSSAVVSDTVLNQLKQYSISGVVTRLYGADRYGTAVAVSKEAFPNGANIVFLAYSMNFPDAVSGAAAAAFFRGPILLTNTATLDPQTSAEIDRLAPQEIVILGSPGVISAGIETTLSGKYHVYRWGGSDRFETSAIIAENTFGACGATPTPCNPPTVYVATGFNYPDALAGAAAAGWTGGPVLLVSPTSVPTSVVQALDGIGAAKAIALGSIAVVSDAVLQLVGQHLAL